MYTFVIQNPAGKIIERFGDVLVFDSRRIVNGIGSLTFSLPAGHPAVPAAGHLATVMLYRREPTQSLNWTLENYGLILARRWSYPATEGGIRPPRFTCTALHPNWLLSTRIVYWKSGTPGRSSFSDAPAETIAKTLVTTNAGSLASAEDGRERDGRSTLLPISVQADTGSGPLLDWHCAYHNLLGTLQRLALASGADFELVPQGNGYEFRWYANGLGSDRRPDVVFSIERGNLANPTYDLDRQDEKTVAVVGGKGQGILRRTLHTVSDAYASDNDIEGFTSSYQAESGAALLSAASGYLARHTPPARLSFDVLQTPSTYYGKHYFLGDWVRVRNPFTGQDFDARVLSTRILFAQPTREHPSTTPSIQIDLGSQITRAEDFPEILEELITAETGPEETLDAAAFGDSQPLLFTLDAGGFDIAYLSSGVTGGTFQSPPG